MMGFSQKKLGQLLKLPDKIIPILLIAIGKPDPQNPELPPLERKRSRDIGYLETYGLE